MVSVDCITVRLLMLQIASSCILRKLCDYTLFDVLAIKPERPDWDGLDMLSKHKGRSKLEVGSSSIDELIRVRVC